MLGFVFLNLTFLFDFLFQSVLRRLLGLFMRLGPDPEMNLRWLLPLLHLSFAAVIVLIAWPVLRSKWKTFFKATFLTVPLAVVLATIGIFLSNWPIAVYSLGGLVMIGVLYYCYRAKLSWLYYYAVILIGATLAIMTLTGVEI